MNKEAFNQIEKILLESCSDKVGQIVVFGNSRRRVLDLGEMNLTAGKKNLLIYVKYFPEEDKYGFAVYNPDKDGERK